jgi:pentatricopeptide repeat protein
VYSLLRYRTQREKRNIIKCFGGVKNGEELSCELYNENICDFCKEGDIDNAMIFLAEMEALGFHPNYLSYSCLISTLGNFGRTSEAEALCQEMMLSKPRLKVYNSLLRAFLRKRPLEAGK